MAHGTMNTVLKRSVQCKSGGVSESKTGAGSRRIFAPHFKLQVLDSYRHDADCKGNQRATARKYGIHRRQIQKWLQVENNLRNTVCKPSKNNNIIIDQCNNNNNVIENRCGSDNNKMRCNRNGNEVALRIGRLLDAQSSGVVDDDGVNNNNPTLVFEPLLRVPAPSGGSHHHLEVRAGSPPAVAPPVPLDFTMQSRVSTASPFVATEPFPRTPGDSPIDLSFKRSDSATAPAVVVPFNNNNNATGDNCFYLSPTVNATTDQSDVWDLSTKKRKFEEDVVRSRSPEGSPLPKTNVKLFKPYLDDFNHNKDSSSSSSSSSTSSFDECPQPYCCAANINNSNVSPVCYSPSSSYEIKAECTYTIQELQNPPKSTFTYCYPYPSAHYLLPSVEYECNNNCCTPSNYYEESNNNNNGSFAPLKQRQSYSLDFKLSAIDCYYEDSVCKGNQRAVANKYNVHRRQVQKWLKQEDELRYRNEAVKYIELVR